MNTMNTIAQRRVVPELIDELPAHDPGAVHSRCDIRRINRVMGHVGIVASSLEPLLAARPSARLIELGAGDGTFLLRVAAWLQRRLPTPPVVEAWLVDRQPLLSIETVRKFARLGWKTREVTSDVFDWLGKRAGPAADVMLANLFLHHFEGDRLRLLLELMAANGEAVIACEPHRSRFPLAAAGWLGLIGCNHVTRHDAVVSVKAGFAGDELSRSWPVPVGWRIQERRAGLFSHLFVARRRD